MTHPLMPDVIAVEVPDWTIRCGLEYDDDDRVFDLVIIGPPGKYKYINLPEGNWAYLFCTADASEEQCAQIVEDGWFAAEPRHRYYDYSQTWPRTHTVADKHVNTAKESLQSLLKSAGLDPKGNYPVLRKLKTK